MDTLLAKRWRTVSVTCCCLLVIAGCRKDHLILSGRTSTLPADGRMHRVFQLRRAHGGELPAASIQASDSTLQVEQDGLDRVGGYVQTPVLPGSSRLVFTWREQRHILTVKFVADDATGGPGGLPDALMLHTAEDRAAFRNWFVAVAEQEASLRQDHLPSEIDDCAALVRYCYREAVARHDQRWFAAQPRPELFAGLLPPRQYHYPNTPLGLNLFRIQPGPFRPADLQDGAFAQFADAHTLMMLNTYRVSRNVRTALPGDLLFFRQLEQNSPYHSMIVGGVHSDWVIYNTGPIGRQKGEIRRVAMQDLLHHPDARWRPVPENTNFLGVYRWNLLHDGD